MRIKLIILAILFFFNSANSVFASTVVLNEMMPEPSSENDWVELYNTTSNNIDLTNWTLVDSTSTMKTLSGTISANGFVVFDVSNRLNKGGDSIYLKDTTNNTLDSYSYSSSPGTDITLGRSPDGGSWITLANSSKGSSNGSASTPSPTPTPTSSPSPTSTPSSTSQTSSFTISNIPSEINSDQSFNVSVNLSEISSPSTKFYLKGAFKKSDSSNYFGLTKVSNSWIKNSSTYSDQYPITTDSQGNWSGSLEVKVDPDDSGFSGTDDYIFKVGKYNSTDSNPSVSWSNETSIKIINVGGTENSTPSPTSSSTKSSLSPQASTTKLTSSQLRSNRLDYHTATVAGVTSSALPIAATSSNNVEVKSGKQLNLLPWIGGILVMAGFGSLIFVYLRNKKVA